MKQDIQPVISVPARKLELVKNPQDKSDQEQVDIQILLEQNYKFFLEYHKLYEANVVLKTELNNLVKEKTDLKQYIMRLERKEKKGSEDKEETLQAINDTYTNRKRHRRSKKEIARSFVCTFANCWKSYGSEGSLNQHIKIKHHQKK